MYNNYYFALFEKQVKNIRFVAYSTLVGTNNADEIFYIVFEFNAQLAI